MAVLNNVKISLRTDDLSNWTSQNPVLNNGELAIIKDEAGNQLFKIGNGISSFNELDYVNQNEVKTKLVTADELNAKAIAQGLKSSAVPLGLAAGAFLSANANFSQAFGFNCETSAGHDYSFVWSGDDQRNLLDYYQTHGKGTFNINPLSGLSGIFIQDKSLAEVFTELSTPLLTATAYVNAKANMISDDLRALQTNSNAVSNDLYVLSADASKISTQVSVDCFQHTDTAVQDAISLIPTNVSQLTNDVGYITNAALAPYALTSQIPTQVSQLENDSGYLTAHQDLSFISNEVSCKVFVGKAITDPEAAEPTMSADLSVVRSLSVIDIDPELYAAMLKDETFDPTTIYSLSNENIIAYGQQIKHVAAGTDSDDAVTLAQMTAAIASEIGNINTILEALN